jgi:hypothetical protein
MIDQDEDREMRRIINTLLEECMASDDALSCAIETIEMIPPGLKDSKPRLVLFTQDDCIPCAEDREKYAVLLANGQITEVDANSPEGKAIMDQNNLEATPSLVLLDCENKLIGELFDSRTTPGEEIAPSAG